MHDTLHVCTLPLLILRRGHAVSDMLQEHLEPGSLVWLMSNTQCERTFIARKKLG